MTENLFLKFFDRIFLRPFMFYTRGLWDPQQKSSNIFHIIRVFDAHQFDILFTIKNNTICRSINLIFLILQSIWTAIHFTSVMWSIFFFFLSLIQFWFKITDYEDKHFLFGITCTAESFTIRLDTINLDCKYIFEILKGLWDLSGCKKKRKKKEHELKIDHDKIRIMIFSFLHHYFFHLFPFLLIHCHLPCFFSFFSLLASFHQTGVWTLSHAGWT